MRVCQQFLAFFVLILSFNYSAAAGSPVVRAVFVGIGDYKHADAAGFSKLRGPSNDVQELQRVLSDRYGLKPDNTVVLIDTQADRESLLRQLRKSFVEDAKPGDVALFYFAGHGSRVYDTSTDEPGRYDSTILSYDARAPDGSIPDITDDEIGVIVTESRAKGVDPVVILDSCHSGTGIRLLTGKSRSAPVLVRPQRSARKNSVITPMSNSAMSHGKMLSAAQDTEEALERDENGLVMGEFTRALVDVLNRSESQITYLDVLNRVRIRLAGRGIKQSPQGEGDLQQSFLMNGPIGRPPVLAHPINNQMVRLGVGAASAVTKGSEYDFFSTAAAAVGHVAPLAKGNVVELFPDYSMVQLSNPAILPSSLYAVERAHYYGDLGLRLAISGRSQPQINKILTLLKGLEYVKIVPDNLATHWLKLDAAGVALLRLDGSRIGPIIPFDNKLHEQLAVLLGRLAHYQALLALTNPSKPNSPIKANIYLTEASNELLRKPKIRDGEAILKPHQMFTISFFNTTAKAKHIYVLNLTPDLCVNLLRPPPYGVDQPLSGLVRLEKPVHAGPELGREYFLILATDRPVPLELLQQPCLSRGATRNSNDKIYSDPLSQLFHSIGANTRAPHEPLALDGWSTSVLSMLVEI